MIDITLRPVYDGHHELKELRFLNPAETKTLGTPATKLVARAYRNNEWIEIEFPISIADFHPDSVRDALELILK